MKYIPSFLITAIIFFSLPNANSQYIRLKAGMNLSNFVAKFNDSDINGYDLKPGYNIGVTAEKFQLTPLISLESGLFISSKGNKIYQEEEQNDSQNPYIFEAKLNLLYIEIPVRAKASIEFENFELYGLAGPYLGIGLHGKSQISHTNDNESYTFENTIEWGSSTENDDYKRLDYGLSFGAGIEFKFFQIELFHNYGLRDISIQPQEEVSYKNISSGLLLGYKFN